jgi:xanthine/CO dehydrogenase XdhC/CoxF family maturation factor
LKELAEILRRLTAAPATGGVLATLVAVAGSSYRRPGARLLVTPAGERIGSISGGCLEEDVITRAASVATSGRPELVTYDTSAENDLIWGVGLGCHGVVQVLLERVGPAPGWATAAMAARADRRPAQLAVIWRGSAPEQWGTRLGADLPADPPDTGVFRQTIAPPPALTVFGAGDDARPLVRFAKELGWYVTVADPRPTYATAERFPEADRRVVAPAAGLVRSAAIEPGSAAVVMTHHYVHDVPVLRGLLECPPAYVGLLGPKQRGERILADLARDGVVPSVETVARFHSPVGLDLGAETPDEVALSIVAEIQAALVGRDARPLRLRHQPIHA